MNACQTYFMIRFRTEDTNTILFQPPELVLSMLSYLSYSVNQFLQSPALIGGTVAKLVEHYQSEEGFIP